MVIRAAPPLKEELDHVTMLPHFLLIGSRGASHLLVNEVGFQEQSPASPRESGGAGTEIGLLLREPGLGEVEFHGSVRQE